VVDVVLRIVWANFQPNWASLLIYVVIPESIAIVGLYGFIKRKKLLTKLFWKIFFITAIFHEFWSVIDDIKLSKELNSNEVRPWFEAFDSLLYSSFEIPLFIALFFYGYQCKDLWGSPKTSI
jgi:hypothetical protein